MKIAKLGIVKGYPDGTIRPNNNITRAEMALIVIKAVGLDNDVKKVLDYSTRRFWYNN
ncbi:UNVERIFIED_CONTAM: endo-1,4-beta-xylanase [Acetivibrio alkalicellulosi]